MKQQLTREDVLRIAGRAPIDPVTVERWQRGERVQPISVERIERAAAELGIKLARDPSAA